LVVDAGGGTVGSTYLIEKCALHMLTIVQCIVMFKQTERGMIQMFSSLSLDAGSEHVTEVFLKLLRTRLQTENEEGLNVDWICRKARKDFDEWKTRMDNHAGKKPWFVPFPGIQNDGIYFKPYDETPFYYCRRH